MKPIRVYIDTSVVGGCLDPEFQEASLRLFELFRTGRMIAVVSDLTIMELAPAPPAVREVLNRIPATAREDVHTTPAVTQLSESYITERVLGPAMMDDASHIAMATLYGVDVLVSWNFKHVVNERRIVGYHAVNARRGLPLIEIRTPAEVIRHGG
jgi:predicted nucleic acid-binding protein